MSRFSHGTHTLHIHFTDVGFTCWRDLLLEGLVKEDLSKRGYGKVFKCSMKDIEYKFPFEIKIGEKKEVNWDDDPLYQSFLAERYRLESSIEQLPSRRKGVKWDEKAVEGVNNVAKALLNLTELYKSQNIVIETFLKIEQPKVVVDEVKPAKKK